MSKTLDRSSKRSKHDKRYNIIEKMINKFQFGKQKMEEETKRGSDRSKKSRDREGELSSPSSPHPPIIPPIEITIITYL